MIISIISYRGGSGKSLFAINLANMLDGINLLIEADFLAPSLYYLVKDVKGYWNDYLLDEKSDIITKVSGIDVVLTKPNDKRLFTHIQNREMWTSKFSDLIANFLNSQKSKRDFIIIDNQSGSFYSSIVHSFFSDLMVVVVRPDKGDVYGTLEYLKTLQIPFYILWNQILDHPKMEETIQKWTDELFAPLEHYQGVIGIIPFDSQAAYHRWVEGQIFVYGTEYTNFIKEISKKLVEIKRSKS